MFFRMTEHNLFQEVQEDLERQRLEALWKRYGAWVVAGALVLVLATGGETAYHSWKIARDQHVTSALLAATKGAEPGKTVELLQKFAQENPNNAQADFALLRAGGLAADQNDRAKAVQLFDQVAGDAQADTALRQLGDLLSVQAQMDVGDPAALSLRLQPFSAWANSAR